jgi:2,3-dihydroxybiphenyl 1,2-dioxygenase
MQMGIQQLAYLGLGVSDIPAWQRVATEVYGMEQADGRGPDGAARLRIDGRAWRIALHETDRNDILYVGFALPNQEAASTLADSLAAAGVSAEKLSREESSARRITGGYRAKDPDGLDIELVYGLQDAEAPFRSPTGASFVTGTLGLGHLVIRVADAQRSLEFYKLLGFKISDFINFQLAPNFSVKLAFLHCNPRHHSLALVPAPLPKQLNHLMLEVDSVDTVLSAYYRAQKQNMPIMRHLGRHTNDHMLSFYAQTPAGFDVEYGFGGRKIGAPWKVEEYDAISIWGHEPQ